MVQVGTMAFDAEAWCHPATVAIAGMTLAKDAPAAVSEFSDGYQLTLTVTAGAPVATEGDAGMCINGEGTGTVCVVATAGDEDGTIAANGLAAKMMAAGSFKPEADNEADTMVDLPAGAAAVMAPASVMNQAAPAPAADAAEDADAPEAIEGQQLADGLNTGAAFSVVYYQPKSAKTYAGLWRFNAKDEVTGYACGPDADTMTQNKKCMTATLTGASTLIAGAAIAFGAAALF